MAKEKDDLFDDANIPPSNWFKFGKVGDHIGGKLAERFDKPSTVEGMQDQIVYVLEMDGTKDLVLDGVTQRPEAGALFNVGIKKNNMYIHRKLNNVQPGDVVGFKFMKEIPPSSKGKHPAKSIEVYVKRNNPEAEAAQVH